MDHPPPLDTPSWRRRNFPWTTPPRRRSPRRRSVPSCGWHHTTLNTTVDQLHADPRRPRAVVQLLSSVAPPLLVTASHRRHGSITPPPPPSGARQGPGGLDPDAQGPAPPPLGPSRCPGLGPPGACPPAVVLPLFIRVPKFPPGCPEFSGFFSGLSGCPGYNGHIFLGVFIPPSSSSNLRNPSKFFPHHC